MRAAFTRMAGVLFMLAPSMGVAEGGRQSRTQFFVGIRIVAAPARPAHAPKPVFALSRMARAAAFFHSTLRVSY